jgi:hypothetical protein
MVIKDPEFTKLVESMAEHFKANIVNRFVKKALIVHVTDTMVWNHIEHMTETPQYKRVDGFDIEEFYDQVLAMGKFVHQVRRELLPNLRNLVAQSAEGGINKTVLNASDKVLRDMAVNNFSANLNVLADMVNELYMRATTFDKANAPKGIPLYTKIPELKQLGNMLIG